MIDQALVLFGKPQAITADIGAHRSGSKIDDYYDITLHYEERRIVLKSSILLKNKALDIFYMALTVHS